MDFIELEKAFEETIVYATEEKVLISIPEMFAFTNSKTTLVKEYSKVQIGKAIENLRSAVILYDDKILKKQFPNLKESMIEGFVTALNEFETAVYEHLK